MITNSQEAKEAFVDAAGGGWTANNISAVKAPEGWEIYSIHDIAFNQDPIGFVHDDGQVDVY